MSDKPILNVFAGGPGTGKTTLGKMFSQGSDIPFINPADKSCTLASPLSNEEAYTMFMKKIEKMVENRESFSLETNLSRDSVEVMASAKKAGYEINMHYLSVENPDVQKERLEKKGQADDKRLESVEKYTKQSFENLNDALYLSDKGIVYNNTGLGPIEAMELRNGVIKDLSSTLPGPVQDKLMQSMSIKEGERIVPSENMSFSMVKGFGM